MARYLAKYDLSGIQSFIFQTNRLKEIAGASYLVSKALFANVPEFAEEEPGEWRTRDANEFKKLGRDDAKVVYVGGGNALVLFGSEDAASKFTQKLKREVFLQTGGALRICSATAPVEDGARLADCLDFNNPNGVNARLDRSKAKAPQPLTARGFSINRLDNESREPYVLFDEPIRDHRRDFYFLPRSRYLKLKEYERQHHSPEERRRYTSPLLELHEGREFEDDFDGFFDEAGSRKGGKRFLAVVHADGNTMGQRISGFIEESRERDQAFEQDLVDMRDMSVCIGDSYKNALDQMIHAVYGEQEREGKVLPFRPVVADGDDITFICLSENAFECFERFVDSLHNPVNQVAEEGRREGLPQAADFSVGCGIALVRSSYPFSSAYEMAEELCKNAKKKAIERVRAGEIEFDGAVAADGAQPPISTVDFHVCSGELVSDIMGFRKRYLRQEAGNDEVVLCMRPYHLGIRSGSGQGGEIDYSLKGFMELLGQLQLRSATVGGSRPWIARGKLKGLRDRYGEGKEQACRFGQIIVERDAAMLKGGADDGGGRRAEFVKGLGKPYISAGGRYFARYFDALDVIDLCEGTVRVQDAAVPEGGAQ